MFGLFRKKTDAADRLYAAIVAQARKPVFYERYGVPDTVDGRFDMLALHASILLERLGKEPGARRLAQALFDRMFQDMEQNIRQMGVGDLSVAKHMKRMMKALKGRHEAYTGAVAEDAVRRNLYGTVESVDKNMVKAMAGYVSACRAALAAVPYAALESGMLTFDEDTHGKEQKAS